jgi:hypothetical protein
LIDVRRVEEDEKREQTMVAKRINYVMVGAIVLVIFWLHGCAGIPRPTRSDRVGREGLLGSCADFFADYDQKIAAAKVLDSGSFRIKGYPYLRVNRFLASFAEEVDDPSMFLDWLDRLQLLDQQARSSEIYNLAGSGNTKADHEALIQRVIDCGNLLKEADFKTQKARENLRKTITVPDEYIEARRFLGIYPITGWFVSRGVSKWHRESQGHFSLEPPANWPKIVRYSPPEAKNLPITEHIASLVERDALGIPKYTQESLDALFAIHAPVWEIETKGNYDHIGIPSWSDKQELQVNIHKPTTYTLPSFTRFGAKIMTQLNYIIWFPSRPKPNSWDLYGGRFDGVNFRVTLDADGSVLLYETIHNCGCYDTLYPTKRLIIRSKIDYAEPPLILKAPPLDTVSEVLVVAIESKNHFVRHLYARPRQMQPEKVYAYEDYQQLRSLPLPVSGRRSMFGQDGIVPGSERLERFILWPSGVFSPGAMRQWGRHAVALVGKRHFDDPFYLEKIFKEVSIIAPLPSKQN